MIPAHTFAVLLGGLLAVACDNEELAGIRGSVTNIHYVIWEQANNKPDTAFIQLDNDMEFRFEVNDRLPLQRGQHVLIQPAAQAKSLSRRIRPACALILMNDKGKALGPIDLAPSPLCG